MADVLSLDKSTASRKVDSLVGKRLLARDRDPDDGGIVRLRPSTSEEAPYDRAKHLGAGDADVADLAASGLTTFALT